MSFDPVTPARPGRSDARRNRERLIEVARAAFASGDGIVSLEGIARAAHVGIGTLYRHFPTREALVEAVYRSELDEVTGSAAELLRGHRPDVALRMWADRYATFVSTKRGMIETLRAGWAAGTIATPSTRQRVTAAIGEILAAGAEEGVLRDDVLADDVTASLVGIFLSTSSNGTPDQVERLLDLLMDGLRPRA